MSTSRGLNILVLGFYYPPDLCAGSFRAEALVASLQALMPAGSHIDIVTTMPNRYQSFTTEVPETKEHDSLRIVRIPLPGHASGMVDQSKAFASFWRGALRRTRGEQYDVVFATSSRLMTAVLGTRIATRIGAPLYLDIRDIFVDTIKDVMSPVAAALTGPLFSILESWAIRRANKVNLVSRGFEEYFRSRYARQRFAYFTNGIDDEFIAAAPTASSMRSAQDSQPITALYAGNLGEGQGMHEIVPALAKRMGPRVVFKIIGDGGRRRELERALAGVSNVELLPPVGRRELLTHYRAADVLFLHLNDYDAFRKVLPSKLFEYGALGKPVWAGVAGYAAEFVATEMDNAVVFAPCNVDEAVRSFERLVISQSPRPAFVQKYARKNISDELARDILSLTRAVK